MPYPLSEKTTVRALVKLRPAAIGLFDKRKLMCWDGWEQPLSEVVPAEALADFLEEAARMRAPAPDSDWAALPLYHLADFLTHEHRGFLLHDLADVGHLLDIHTIADSGESAGLRKIQGAFGDFRQGVQTHVEEQESYLYPKILRYEACLRDQRVNPEFHRGSVQSYMAMRMSQDDKRLLKACAGLAEEAARLGDEHPSSFALRELGGLLQGLAEKLAAHAGLESRHLFPLAGELERNLYNLTIGGDPAVAYHRRGPMDSGILRLRLKEA